MKKILFFLLAFVFAGSAMAQTFDEFLEGLESINQQCPIPMGQDVGDITSVTYSNGNVEFVYTLNEDLVNIAALKESPEAFKQSMMTIANGEGMKPMVKMMANYDGIGLKLIYRGRNTGQELSALITHDELQDLADGKVTTGSPHDQLVEFVRITNMQMPLDLGDGLTETACSMEDGYIVFQFSCDENVFSIDDLEKNSEESKQTILENIRGGSPVVEKTFNDIRRAGYGAIYRYIGKSSKRSIDIKIENSEM